MIPLKEYFLERALLALALGALFVHPFLTAQASGIFTLHGKLKGFTETTYTIQAKTVVYDIKKSGLSKAQLDELKTKKTGQEVDLVVSTEAVADVHDVK